jgi:signal transduction histidine kinase
MGLPSLDTGSLRVRMMMLAVVTIGLTLLVAGVSLTVLFERHILVRVAQELETRWIELAGVVAVDDTGRLVMSDRPMDPRYARPLSGAYWQVAVDGEPVERSRSLWDQALPIPAVLQDEPYEVPGIGDGSELYILTRPLLIGDGADAARLVLTVALDHADVEAQNESFRRDVMVTLGLIAFVLVVGSWAQINHGLSPLSAIRRALRDIREGRQPRLGKGYASEVQPLADDLDRLLDRQDELVAKARDRAGALAHGLKTPRTVLGLEARRLATSGRPEAAAVLEEQVGAMRGHVERELARSRARGTASSAALGERSSDLADVTRRVLAVMARMPYADRLDVDVRIAAGTIVRIDSHDLAEVLGNLLDNARKWARSRITVEAERTGRTVMVTIGDDGPGLDAAPTGDRQSDGSGIGLAIVEDVLGEYGVKLERTSDGVRTLMRFSLPAAGSERLPLAAE